MTLRLLYVKVETDTENETGSSRAGLKVLGIMVLTSSKDIGYFQLPMFPPYTIQDLLAQH